MDVARFCQRRSVAKRDAHGDIIVPGLELVQNADITAALSEEILELARKVQDAQTIGEPVAARRCSILRGG